MQNHDTPTPRNWRFWSPRSSTVDVRQGDRNTDNFTVLKASLAILAAIGIGIAIYYWMVPDPALVKPAG